MKILTTVEEVRKEVKTLKSQGKSVGLVPTMGYLHEGHISLVEASVRDNDITVMSIFVNPTQFGENEDYDKYPRDIDRDSKIAESAGVDIIFAPDKDEMYKDEFDTYVTVGKITQVMCGKSRPGHFRGVTTVVSKLFNIVNPDRAYFGQKDMQQAVVIKKMVKDLNMDVEIVTCPIVRENDGLAMSSRNTYLTSQQRKSALVLSQSLFEAEKMVKSGERDSMKLRNHIKKKILSKGNIEIDYIEIVDTDSLMPVDKISDKALIALAVKIGKTRLIDNVIVEV